MHATPDSLPREHERANTGPVRISCHSRIRLHREALHVGLAADTQSRAEGARERSALAAEATTAGRQRHGIPVDSMHAGARRERLGRGTPERRYVGDAGASTPATARAGGRALAGALAREGVQHLAVRAQNFDGDLTGGVVSQVVVDGCAVRWVRRLRFVLLERRAVVAALLDVHDVSGLE